MILGVVFFLAKQLVFSKTLPVVGPVSQERIAVLINQWQADSGRPPTAEQKSFLIAAELDQKIMFLQTRGDSLHDLGSRPVRSDKHRQVLL